MRLRDRRRTRSASPCGVVTSDEAPHDACTCDLDEPRFDCRRVRDYVVVKAFTETRARRAGRSGVPSGRRATRLPVCTALTACSACACGESWILLGCVTLDKDQGIVDEPDTCGRRWVKPVEALCPGLVTQIGAVENATTELSTELSKLTDRVAALEKQRRPVKP